MLLKDLVENGEAVISGSGEVSIDALSADSRKVAPGTLFAALKGTRSDGMAFVHDAVSSGASAVLAASPAPAGHPANIPWVLSKDPRHTLSTIAARFYADQPEMIVGITGTSGKTSVASFLRQIYSHCGFQAASLGTLGIVTQQGETQGSLTTPDPIALHWMLSQLAQAHVTHLALEASSHGLDQYRLHGVRFKAGAFTNLTRDHLDYHPDMESYLQAKLKFINELLPEGAPFIVAADSPYADDFIDAARAKKLNLWTVGEGGEHLQLIKRERLAQGQHLSLGGPWGRAELVLPLIGDFQTSNALVAAGLALATGCAAPHVFAALEILNGVKGRMEKVAEKNGAGIYIDYAHKPDAMAKLLDSIRPYVQNRLLIVFGCGGDRDQGKRPLMGTIAAEKADIVIVTDDNPRSEKPADIRRAILEAAPGATEIGDRGEAIRAAIAQLQNGDVLIVAGKGHETGQIVGTELLPFSDHEAVRLAIEASQ